MDNQGAAQHNSISTLNSAIGTALAFPFGPGVLPVLITWLITHWQAGAPYPLAVRTVGISLIVAGGILSVWTFV
jgi:hypothetical protein